MTRFKSVHAEWLVELFNQMTTSQSKKIIMSGWKASGIIEAIKKGWTGLPNKLNKTLDY